MNYNEELIKIARKYIGIKETGNNQGKEVIMFQKAVDGIAKMESWCMCYVQYCIKEIEKAYNLKSNIYKSEHVMTVWDKTSKDFRLLKPELGCLILWNFTGTTSGHAGIVTSLPLKNRIMTIEGNTSDGKGVVREGDGVYERNRSIIGSNEMKVVGFLKPFN